MDRAAHVAEAVGRVVDPCARMNGTGLTLGELGMIDDVRVEGGRATVRLLLDDPVCVYLGDIKTDVEAAALEVAGVSSIHLEVRGDALWTSDRMTPGAKEKTQQWAQARRRRTLPQVPGSAVPRA